MEVNFFDAITLIWQPLIGNIISGSNKLEKESLIFEDSSLDFLHGIR